MKSGTKPSPYGYDPARRLKTSTALAVETTFPSGRNPSCLHLRRRLLKSVALLVAALLLTTTIAACNRAASSGSAAGQLQVASHGENLRFDPIQLTTPPGQEVNLAFSNQARNLRRSWVLVEGGKAMADQVYAAGQKAGLEHGFVPVDHPSVLAATTQVDGGKSKTITFTTPATPGDYFYICTTPGHYLAGMHGVLTIT